jgi:putative tryptophan/tyrosine transport system substrate-binding protein
MRRRDFIAGLGGAAAWPVVARAQQPDRMRRVGFLQPNRESDPEAQASIAAFRLELGRLGWIDGRNVRIDYRWDARTSNGKLGIYAAQVVSLKPDVILVVGPAAVKAVQRENPDISIVFAAVSDPVGLGFVESLARPGGNVTGFTLIERSVGGKLLEALKEFVPDMARAALLTDPQNPASPINVNSFESAARSLAVAPIVFRVRNTSDIERAIGAFGQESNGGLVFTPETVTFIDRELIIALAARLRLPAVYGNRAFVTSGGLMSYGTDSRDNYRGVASYVDRILRGEKPADLPVQQPVKFQFAVNLKTAKAIGLTVPLSILLRADEVIE